MALGTWTVVIEGERVNEEDVAGYRFYAGSVAQGPDVPQSAGNPQKTITMENVESTIPAATFGITAVDNAGLESLRTDLTVRLDADAPTKPGALRLVSAVFVPAS